MIPTSDKWVDTITAPLRYQGLFKFALDLTSPGIYDSIQTDAPGLDPLTTSDYVFDRARPELHTPMTLERNRTRSDGSFRVLASENLPLLPQYLSEAPQLFNITLSKQHDVPQVQIEWDFLTHSYASKFAVTGFNILGNPIKTVEVLDNENVNTTVEVFFEDCKSLQIKILEWFPKTWRPRISKVFLGMLIEFREFDRTISASQVRRGSIISSRIPEDTVELFVDNLDQYLDPLMRSGYVNYLSQRQLITWQWGITALDGEQLWLPKQKYFLNSWTIPSQGIGFALRGTSRLDFLSEQFRQDITEVGTERTFRQLVDTILLNSSIIRIEGEDNPWIVPDLFDSLSTTASIPIKAVKELLRDIAAATGTVLDIDTLTGYIRFRVVSSTVETLRSIEKGHLKGKPEVESDDPLKSLRINISNYSAAADVTNLATVEVSQAQKDFEVPLRTLATNITVASESGPTPTNVRVTSGQVLFDVSGPAVIVISGREIVRSVHQYTPYIDTALDTGLNLVDDQWAITNLTSANARKNILLKILLGRRRLVSEYLGFPELELYEFLPLTSKYGTADAYIGELELHFNGGYSGKVVTRLVADPKD